MTAMPTADAVAAIGFTSVEEDLERHDVAVNESQDVRAFLLNKVTDLINATDFTKTPQGLADASGRLAAVNTALAIIKDRESAERNRASLKFKQKDTESTENVSLLVTELLRKKPISRISADFKDVSDEQMDDLDREISESDNPIRDDETLSDPYTFSSEGDK